MNTRKDFLLIFLGAALFAGGLAVYLTPGLLAPAVPDEEARASQLTQLRESPPAGAAYPATPRASLEDNVKDWLNPEEDEDNWDYDLFTTIDVVWDPAIKEYVPRSRKIEEMPPFGITLVSVGHPVYPYMLSHSTLGPSRKEEDRKFSIKNVKTKQYLDDCKLNKPIPEAPFLTLKAYKVVKGKDADGIPFVRNVLTIDDRQFGQVVEVDDEKPLEFKGRIDIILASPSDPSWSLTLHAVGDRFVYNGATYVVKGIDLPNKSVSFDKTFVLNPKKPKKLASDPQTLVVPPPPPPASKTKSSSPVAPKPIPSPK
jgi:hypothetical protein